MLADRSDSSQRYAELTEAAARAGISDPYFEHEPSVLEELRQHLCPTAQGTINYLRSLFPFIGWLPRYNRRWLLGDAIAGLTVGLVVIPQAMAYALLATLSPDFGLYTSFSGAATYWLFGTSKDIVIGTTAVGSLLVGSVITNIQEAHPGVYSSIEIAKALTFMSGAILLTVGLLRLGWVVEVIPYIPVSAFITAASITIMSTQFPVMLGIRGINTREEPYKVIISTLRNLGNTQLDAAIGITCLVLLEGIKFVCSKLEARRPAQKRIWSTISSLRLTFAMLLYTLVSWLVHRNIPRGESKFRIVGKIESGFKYVGAPRLDAELIRIIIPQTPIIMLILVIEHIAIAKNFGQRYGYRIVPSQEIMAQGTANLLGPFLGGYACTGSFGASAVLTKAGVKTPLAGLFSALVLLLALYALTAVFYYIPNAALAGLIIHAVANLIASPKKLYKYWRMSPLEAVVWVIGVVVAIFAGLETAIYTTIGLSMLIFLVEMARTKGDFLGRVPIWRVPVDLLRHHEASLAHPPRDNDALGGLEQSQQLAVKDVYMPLKRSDAANPDVHVQSLYPGVFLYRFPAGLNYLNQALHLNCLAQHVLTHTRRTTERTDAQKHDILWCESPVPHRHQQDADDDNNNNNTGLPVLKAIVLDFSSVHRLDVTSVQGLADVRDTLDRHAAPYSVEWHCASLWSRWARRALATAGFGYASNRTQLTLPPISALTTSCVSGDGATVLEEGGARHYIAGKQEEDLDNPFDCERSSRAGARVSESENNDQDQDLDLVGQEGKGNVKGNNKQQPSDHTRINGFCRESNASFQPVFALDRPFFHIDLEQAVLTAVQSARRND